MSDDKARLDAESTLTTIGVLIENVAMKYDPGTWVMGIGSQSEVTDELAETASDRLSIAAWALRNPRKFRTVIRFAFHSSQSWEEGEPGDEWNIGDTVFLRMSDAGRVAYSTGHVDADHKLVVHDERLRDCAVLAWRQTPLDHEEGSELFSEIFDTEDELP